MAKYYGIDVSTHNGNLDYAAIKNSGVEFAMVRAGYGKGNIDSKFVRNMNGFIKAGIAVGAYWFLYSLTVADAINEANHFDKALSPFKGKISFPVGCDFEYDSENYMRKKGVTPSKRLNTDIVKAFCKRLEELGWYVVNYTNIDFLNNHFNQSELKDIDIWCARWGPAQCSIKCGIWQYSSKGKVNGSSANTDLNYAYNDYPTIIKNACLNGYVKHSETTAPTELTVQEAINIIQTKTGLEEQTIQYLLCYKYAEPMLIKLAKAMQ